MSKLKFLEPNEFNGPRDKGKLEPIYTGLYDILTNSTKPFTKIVELGMGSGACTVAMARVLEEKNIKGNIKSFDKFHTWGSSTGVVNKLKLRKLESFVDVQRGDVFETWVKNPTEFDFLFIDIDNIWESIYKVVIENEYINKQIKDGAVVYFEGGAENHPRMNEITLNNFHNRLGKKVFKFKHLLGTRVSLSKLELI
tara:strand:+ start:3498 stop:4088 length:591 start_codon:yes stop_codon:yes gene_type:complete